MYRRQMPAAPSGKSYESCYVIGGAAITHERCERLNREPRNRDLCKNCASPRRKCEACRAQHLEDDEVWVTNPKKGLCDFHAKYGTSEVRKANVQTESKPYRAPEARPAVPTPTRPSRNPKGRSQLRLEQFVTRETLLDISKKIFSSWERLSTLQRQVLLAYSQGLSGTETADTLNTTYQILYRVSSEMYHMLGVPEFNDHGTSVRSQLRRQTLGKAYEMYRSRET